jgi:DNA processing protein
MDATMTELAALVALLRRSTATWSDVALDVQDNGSALNVLTELIERPDSLLPDPAEIPVGSLIESVAAEIGEWQADGIGVHAFFGADYPRQLRAIREMPPILFTRGRLEPDQRAVAVVGSRTPSDSGLKIARAVAASLAGQGVTVVSGLAKGIDTASHRAALDAGGRTVAVVGTGIRRHYPAANRQLQDHIADVGLLVSQFWPDAGPAKHQFPMRNAVMSGYSAATVVVEAALTSGARIQARLALQHGRPVVLTSQVMQHEWARAFADKPGVHVVGSTAQLLEVVDEILGRLPSETSLESFPDLAAH